MPDCLRSSWPSASRRVQPSVGPCLLIPGEPDFDDDALGITAYANRVVGGRECGKPVEIVILVVGLKPGSPMSGLLGQRFSRHLHYAKILTVYPDAPLEVSVRALLGIGKFQLWLHVKHQRVQFVHALAADVV